MWQPRKKIDEEYSWQDLNEGLEKIYTNKVSRLDYFRLYTLIYDCCTIIDGKTQRHIEMQNYLASFLEKYLKCISKESADLSDEPLLSLYMKRWQDYRESSRLLNNICAYINRFWINVDYERVCRKTSYALMVSSNVYQLALVSWETYLLEPIKNKMCSALLMLINRERKGENINENLIGTAVKSYLEMGFICCSSDSCNTGLYLYIEAFEVAFLAESQSFYEKESTSYIHENPISEYMKKILKWLNEEQTRVFSYLHESTLTNLNTLLENTLISQHIGTFLTQFKTLLSNNMTEDLNRMYRIMEIVSSGLDLLKLQFEKYITSEGLQAIEKVNMSNVNDFEGYIKTIIDIQQRFHGIIETAFENEVVFFTAFDKACKKIINKNSVTESSGSLCKSAESLAKYSDFLLKKTSSELEEVEMIHSLNKAIKIFKYIDEKDAFQRFYNRMFALRLLQRINKPGNDDAEKYMISKLKEICGCEYVAKLQGMFQDVCVSHDIVSQFKTESSPLDVDFNISVFNRSSWSFKQNLSLLLPQELEKSVQQFNTFYCNRYSGRKLIWLHGMSRGVIVSNCFKTPHTFQASTFQMAILLQFNTQNSLSFNQLEENTAIRSDILLQILKSLSKLKLLKDANDGSVTESSSIELNENFANKKQKVNINILVKSETTSDQEAVNQEVKEERELLIQAAIVRTAKANKVVKHQILVSEVINQLSSRFTPQLSVIKKCIEILIEKEYLKREGEDSYCYVV